MRLTSSFVSVSWQESVGLTSSIVRVSWHESVGLTSSFVRASWQESVGLTNKDYQKNASRRMFINISLIYYNQEAYEQ